MSSFNTYEAFCKGFKDDNPKLRERAQLLYFLRSWFNARLDADTSLEEYSNLDELTSVLPKSRIFKDGVSKIVDNSRIAFKHIAQGLHEKIIRENKLVPIYKVREVNSYGLNWLSKRNGRTIREKLSGTSSMMAVQQRNSLDNGENRLFIAFAKRLLDTLEIKSDFLPVGTMGEEETSFQEDIVQLLRREDIAEIRRWENLPPNNTLLSDKYYSTIWRGWNDLQKLDELIKEDDERLDKRALVYVALNLLQLARKDFSLAQQPVEVDYEHFDFIPLMEWVTGTDRKGNVLKFNWKTVDESGENCIRLFFNQKSYVLKIKENILYVYRDGKEIKQFLLKLSLLDKILANLGKELWGGRLAECVYTNKLTRKEVGQKAIVDIFAVRPNFVVDDQSSQVMPFRVMRESFRGNGTDQREYDVSVAMSDSIYAKNGDDMAYCYTLNSVLNNPKDIRAPRLLSLISNHLHVNKLTFLFPDIYNDFQLGNLRKASRLYYGNVEALPMSIAGAFSFAQTPEFENNFEPEDSVIVANLVNDKCSLTLLESDYDEELEKAMPQLKGILWERHPSSEYPAVGYKQDMSYVDMLELKLLEQDCDQTEFVKENYATQGIGCESGKLILQDRDGQAFAIDKSIEVLERSTKCDITAIVKDFLATKKNFLEGKKLHIILLTDKLLYNGAEAFSYSIDYLLGAQYYETLAPQVNKPLWKDHLPDLAIKQFLGVFDLVKDKTIEPMVNNVIEIKIKEHFTLPARKPKDAPDYHFKLQMNDGNDNLQYEAVVSHPAFPLKKDVECYLHMTYNYGADEPYTLIFEPLDKSTAGFTEARVEFKPIEEYPYKDLPVPDFPYGESWDELTEFVGRDGDKINLVDWAGDYFVKSFEIGDVLDLSRFEHSIPIKLNPKLNVHTGQMETSTIFYVRGTYAKKPAVIKFVSQRSRHKEVVEEDYRSMEVICSLVEDKDDFYYETSLDWKKDKWGNPFAAADVWVGGFYEKVFFYEKSFIFPKDREASAVTFKIRQNKRGRYVATDVVKGKATYYRAKDVRKALGIPEYNNRIVAMASYLFPMHKIFYDGRNIDDYGCPADLRKKVLEGVPKLINVFPKLSGYERSTALKVLSLTVSSSCPYFYPLAKELISNYSSKNKINDEIGFVLGDCSTSDQIELFNRVVFIKKARKSINILSKAAWKNRNFILQVNQADLLSLFDKAVRYLIKGRGKLEDQLSMYEFVLAVLRLRSLQDEGINKYLSLNNPELLKLCRRIEEMVDKDIVLPRSRLQLSVKRSEAWKDYKISNFLYACLVYITGESGESEIKITGITESDKDSEEDED